MALQDLNARLAQKQEPLEEWPTLFDDDDGQVKSPSATVAVPSSAPADAPATEDGAPKDSASMA